MAESKVLQVIKNVDMVEDDEDEEDDDEVSKELSEKMTNLSMQSWLNLNKSLIESNAVSLDEETQITLPKIGSFIKSLEAYGNITRRYKLRRAKSKGDGEIARCLEKMFLERLSLGMLIMNKIVELLRLERLDFNNVSNIPPTRLSGSINEYEISFQVIIAKFARILDARGIVHNFVVSPTARASLIEEERKLTAPTDVIEPPVHDTLSQAEEVAVEEKEIESAAEFLQQIVSRNNLTLAFRSVPSKEPDSYEQYFACDFDQFTVTAKGATRLAARNNSASKMIKLLMREQQRGNSISTEKFALLTDEELETAVRILCLTENYVLRLRKVCEMHTAHSPKFTTLCEKPMFTVKCEALGYKATGSHKRQYIAKKIAAKKLLMQMPNEGDSRRRHDIHQESFFRHKEKKVKFSMAYRESSLN